MALGFETNYGDTEHIQKHLVDKEVQVSEYHLNEFFSIMIERQRISEKRMKGLPFPWTNNPILRDYKYTNVYRELDRNSQYEIDNIILNESLTNEDTLFQILMYRMFNQPKFFEYCSEETKGKWYKGLPTYSQYKSGELIELINKYRKQGGNPFTNAYLTNSRVCPGMTRDWCFGNKVIPDFHKKIPDLLKLISRGGEPENLVKEFVKLPSVSYFVAHEFFISLCYLAKYREETFFPWDEMDYTNVGPGASLGIRIIFPNLDSTKKQLQAIHWLHKMSKDKFKELGGFRYLTFDKKQLKYVFEDKGDITLHNIEFYLCEYSKYFKMIHKVGKQRMKYVH